MESSQKPFCLGPPLTVNPDAIERGLAQLWRNAGATLATATETALIRSCTVNFAVLLARADLAADTSDAIAALAVRHPCRAFLLTAEPQAPVRSFESSVSALCHPVQPGGHHICCEQVSVAARGDATRELPHLLLGLLVPDLPLVLWWRGGLPLDSPSFGQMSAVADRILVDSADLADSPTLLVRLAQLLREHPAALADLAWNRLTEWRELTAQFFDIPRHRPYLDRVDDVVLEVSARALYAEAPLWLGWLASRLGWTVTASEASARGYVCTFDSGAGPVHAEVRSVNGGEPDPMQRVELAVSTAARARFRLQRQDARCVEASTQLADDAPSVRTIPLARRDRLTLLGDELDLVGHDRVYEEALAAAACMAEILGR